MPYKDKDYMKKYREKNKESIKQQKREYNQTPQGKKCKTIGDWKHLGLKLYGYTYDEVYEYFQSIHNCEVCNVKLNTNIKTQKCMDHCHDTGCFRWVLCRSCNTNDYWMKRI